MLELIIVAAYTVAGWLLSVVASAKPDFTLMIIAFLVAGAALASLVAALAPKLAAQPRPFEAGAGAPAQAALSRT